MFVHIVVFHTILWKFLIKVRKSVKFIVKLSENCKIVIYSHFVLKIP